MANRPINNTASLDAVPAQSEIDKAVANVQHAGSTEVAKRDMLRKQLGAQYNAEPKVSVMIAPMYKAFFGNVMHVSINGISISVPCDGKPYPLPESYAAVVQERLRLENDRQAKQKRFSDVGRNSESSPGELTLY